MNAVPSVILRPGEGDRVIAGHPWIYSGSILRLSQSISDGSVVQVKDHRKRFLGVGLYNSKSKISVRVLSPERTPIDEAFFQERITEALSVRQRHMPKAASYRVVNSEADLLSGLIIDKYEDVIVIQTSALGMDVRKGEILSAIRKVFSPRAIVERNDIGTRQFEGLGCQSGVLYGQLETESQVRLNSIRFNVQLLSGHKTGLYLDQQENYRLVAELVMRLPGAQVLDCFSFMGGFALHLARSGVAHVHGLEQNAEIVEIARRNAADNGVENVCSFDAANVFDWLKVETTLRTHEKLLPKFDAIILDPPSFTRTRAAVRDALRGYKEIHLRALKLIKRGGILATFCCSHHVGSALFQEVIMAAAFDARRLLRRVAIYSQAADHPVLPSVPETEYLKGFAFELVR